MANLDIARRRLHNQRLVGAKLDTPEAIVAWLGAVQSQDYAGAAWGLGQRTTGADAGTVDRAFDAGAILRTHVMRPTWHFVTPADLRWLLALTAPRVHAANASSYRKLELDAAVFTRSHALLAAALQGGRHLTRKELAVVLENGGIPASGQRLAYLMMRAELDALICSGARRGKQFTYALLDERVPPAPPLDRDEALAELTRRYFMSHGPATPHDFAWWSGLTLSDARAGLELVKPHLVQETVDGKVYWLTAPVGPPEVAEPVVHLLPNYDEHVVAYKDHRPSLDPGAPRALEGWGNALTAHLVVRNGLVVGGWRRSLEKSRVAITTDVLIALDDSERDDLKAAAEGYGRFVGLPVTLSERG